MRPSESLFSSNSTSMLSPIRETAQFCTPSSFFTVRSMPEEHAAHVIPVIEYFFFMIIALSHGCLPTACARRRGRAAARPFEPPHTCGNPLSLIEFFDKFHRFGDDALIARPDLFADAGR